MPSFNGATVRVFAPTDADTGGRDHETVLDALEESDDDDVALANAEGTGYVDILGVDDGKLVAGAWTGAEHGDGWYVEIQVPLLPNDSLRKFLGDLSGTLANFSERFSVEKVRTAPVDADGRVSVGKEYAGENKRVAVLNDAAENQHEADE